MGNKSLAKRTAVVIPAHNENATIKEVAAKAIQYADLVIVVDDASNDGTGDLVAGSCTVIINKHNLGKGRSLKRGLNYALEKDVDFIVMLDGDGEDDPDEIPKLLEKLKDVDVVIASRDKRRNARRAFLNDFVNWWLRFATEYELNDPCSGYNAFRKDALESLELKSDKFQCETEIVLESKRNNLDVAQVDVVMPTLSDSQMRTIHSVQINNFFDAWILRNVWGLHIPFWKKLVLVPSSIVGLIGGKIMGLFVR